MVNILRRLTKRILKDYDNLSDQNSSNTSERYYLSIDEIPLFNWFKCHDGKLKYTRKNRIGSEKEDLESWTKIYDEYLSRFGINEEFQNFMQKQIDKAIKECEYLETGNRKLLNDINILEAKIRELMNTGKNEISSGELLQVLSKFQGYRIDVKTITVGEYFDLINIYKKQNNG